MASNLKLKRYEVIPVHIINLNGGIDLQIHSFLFVALNRDEWSALRPTLYPMKTSP